MNSYTIRYIKFDKEFTTLVASEKVYRGIEELAIKHFNRLAEAFENETKPCMVIMINNKGKVVSCWINF